MKDTTKLNLRMSSAVREEAATLAESQGLSLNAYLLRAVMNANQYWGPKLVKQARQRAAMAEALKRPTTPAASSREVPKVGANQPCPCGSGQKYKRCHGQP